MVSETKRIDRVTNPVGTQPAFRLLVSGLKCLLLYANLTCMRGIMKSTSICLGFAAALVLGACVTINVYFPAAAAEKAADRIIEDVWGKDAKGAKQSPTSTAPQWLQRGLLAVLDVLIPSASAQANLEISSAPIKAIKASMTRRHKQLADYYNNGAIGLTSRGLVALHNAKAVSIKDRAKLNKLIAAENRDRDALYRAIAQANGHPEWEPDIRGTFARRWVNKAAQGWWYQSGGAWRQR